MYTITHTLSQSNQNSSENNNFYLFASDGMIAFSSVAQQISALGNFSAVPYESVLLTVLSYFVEQLPFSARTHFGQRDEKINSTTLFINPLVKLAQRPSLAGDNHHLAKLYDAANYLDIKPLIHLFASYIADRIYPLTTSLKIALKAFLPNEEKSLINHKPIEKYLRLKELGVNEFTISDYLGLYGQPKVIHKKIDLSKEHLTSLQGLELIHHPEWIEELVLDHNFLLFDERVDISEYLRPFSNLKKMSLSGNRPSNLPLSSFHSIKNIQLIL
jgi:hypothetical protein